MVPFQDWSAKKSPTSEIRWWGDPATEKSTFKKKKVAFNSFENQLFRTRACQASPSLPGSSRFALRTWIFNEVLFLAQVCELERSHMLEPAPTNRPFSGIFKHFTVSCGQGHKADNFQMQSALNPLNSHMNNLFSRIKTCRHGSSEWPCCQTIFSLHFILSAWSDLVRRREPQTIHHATFFTACRCEGYVIVSPLKISSTLWEK